MAMIEFYKDDTGRSEVLELSLRTTQKFTSTRMETIPMSEKVIGQDFRDLLSRAREIPEVKEQLNSFSMAIANLVLARRLQLKLTQKELANSANSTQATISRIESGDAGVKLDTLNSIFKTLGLIGISPQFKEEAATITI
jgi:DNA-binding Xre family transcriptional regulator